MTGTTTTGAGYLVTFDGGDTLLFAGLTDAAGIAATQAQIDAVV